jgi:molecular chaperone GrpE
LAKEIRMQDEPILETNEEIDSSINELDELRDQLLRAHAENQTLRRRLLKEVDDAKTYSISKFAEDLLAVADSLERALGAVPEEIKAADGIVDFLKGVELTEKALIKVLSSYGIEKHVPLGEKLNPELHQALFDTHKDDVEPGTILQVIQPGYVIGTRLLRPALVEVAKKA